MSAEVIRPFVRWDVAWVVEHHGIFQMLYYAHHYGWDRNARDRFRDHPCFDSCAEFCERWDQSSFDPDYDSCRWSISSRWCARSSAARPTTRT
jgi:predicted HD phosphohydrolase